MKFAIVLLACMFAACAAKSIDTQVFQADPRIVGFLTNFYNQIIAEPINVLASSLAGMLVHLTAGIAENGIGKRDILDFFNQLGQNLWSGIAPVVDGAVSNLALQLTLALANLAQNGIGKREIMEHVNVLGNHVMELLLTTGNNLLSQLLSSAEFSQLSGLLGGLLGGIGKRDIFDVLAQLGQNLWNGVAPVVDSAVSNLALQLTLALANLAQNGIGKRQIIEHVNVLGNHVMELLLTTGNNLLSQLLSSAEFSQLSGLLGGLLGGLGKRGTRMDWSSLLSGLLSTLQVEVPNLVGNLIGLLLPLQKVDPKIVNLIEELVGNLQNLAVTGANQLLSQLLSSVEFSQLSGLLGGLLGGIGKRELMEHINNLGGHLTDLALTAGNQLLAQLLSSAEFSQFSSILGSLFAGIGK